MNHSTADILRYYCVNAGVVTLPTDESDWPAFTNVLNEQTDELALFSDTMARIDGRYHRTGQSINHPGCQIIVRSLDQQAAWRKIAAIAKIFDATKRQQITIEGTIYLIEAVSRRGDPISLATEQRFKALERQVKEIKLGRFMFALNCFATIQPTNDSILLTGMQSASDVSDYWVTQTPLGDIDGMNLVFTIDSEVGDVYFLYFDDVLQARSGYTIDETTITFASGSQPEAGTVLKLVSTLEDQ